MTNLERIQSHNTQLADIIETAENLPDKTPTEDIPELSEPLTLIVSKEGAEEGKLVVAYNLSEKVALPAGTNKQLGFLQDANYVPSNIKKDVYLFGLKGEYEGEGGGGDEFPADKYFEGGYAEVNLPNATQIRAYAFYFDATLEKISIPKATWIGSYAFHCCSKLAAVELSSELTSVVNNAFYDCTGLTNITFKSTPTSIGNRAFYGCTNLTTINVPWAEGAVANAPWGATNATINYNYTGE